MLSNERQKKILNLLDENGSIQVSELIDLFNVSDMTIRRDLILLERKGLLRRVHGGAVLNRGRSYEPPFLSRTSSFLEQKEMIGLAAAQLIQVGESIMLDVGTTTLEVARAIPQNLNLTIITPSMQIASLLVDHPSVRVILTGGILRPGELSLVGHLAEQAVRDFFVDKLFLGAAGVDLESGLTEFNLEDTLVKQAMLDRAKEVILVVDSTKFSKVAFTAIAPITVVHHIITDREVPDKIAQQIEKMGIKLTLA